MAFTFPDLPTTPIDSQALDTLFTHTWFKLQPKATDNILKANVITAALQANGCYKTQVGERHISRPIRYGTKTAIGIQKGDTLPTGEDDAETVALWNWKYFSVHVQRSLQDDQMNSGEGRRKELVATKLEMARDSMATKVEDDILRTLDTSGTLGATVANGLREVRRPQSLINILPPWADDVNTYMGVTDTTVYAYGGIDTGVSNTFWQSKGRSFTAATNPAAMNMEDDMRKLYNDCGEGGSDTPNLIIMNQTLFETYESVCANKIQLVADVGSTLAKLGYDVLKFKGAQVVWTPHASLATDAGQRILMFNTRWIDYVYDPRMWMQMIPWQYLPNQVERITRIVSASPGVVTSQLRRHGSTAAYTV